MTVDKATCTTWRMLLDLCCLLQSTIAELLLAATRFTATAIKASVGGLLMMLCQQNVIISVLLRMHLLIQIRVQGQQA
jgi:hypothetical protein